ncbi:hypothetical protein GCM10011519_07260 [Marmoricola endophyticus]|uniref:Uncharacterized protein n=1 Tax=Marmoricola endophyticus TaxID=2040280 RepID=A0A917BCZ2_9ACTN|nr:hypothetical protein [Marmoricola endophyticus]GGF36307.1 hypothetical protein GCM10011519_07260 [Marmoricola endophyticus]
MGADLARQQERQQAALDKRWDQLLRCVPEEVLQALIVAFADNEAAAAPLGVDGAEVSLVVVVPSLSTIPERRPGLTKSGNLSLKKMTKTETAKTYKQLVFGHVLVTLREAFAVAPGLKSARIVALRSSSDATKGRPEALLAATCSREALAAIPWSHVDAADAAVQSLSDAVFIEKGVTRALQPIPADKHPDIKKVLSVVDFSEG